MGQVRTTVIEPGRTYLCRALEDQGKIKKGDEVWTASRRGHSFGLDEQVYVLDYCNWFIYSQAGEPTPDAQNQRENSNAGDPEAADQNQRLIGNQPAVYYFEILPRDPAPAKLQNKFFLASCPEHLLEAATIVTYAYKGTVVAGDRDDFFNKEVLFNAGGTECTRWKEGMLGKLLQQVKHMTQLHPGENIIAVAIAGGKACDWERQQLVDPEQNPHSLRQKYPDLGLFVCPTVLSLKKFLDRGAPADECN